MEDDLGYLYVLKEIGGGGWIKVGKTKDPIKRLKAYNSSFSSDRMYYSFVSEKLYNITEAENILLQVLRDSGIYRQRRLEWFKTKGINRIHHINFIINTIEKITDTYFEGE